MTIHEQEVLDVVLLHISGRVTLTDGAELLGKTVQRLVQQGKLHIVLDLLDVPYIDSTALGTMLKAYTTLSRRGGALKLLHVRGHVRELLTLTKLLDVFESFDSDAQAVASFKPAAPRET